MALSVNSEIIPQGRIEYEANCMRSQYFQAMHAQGTEMSEEELEAQLQEWARENVIEEVLIRQAAERKISEVPEEMLEAALEQVKTQFGGPEAYADFEAGQPAEYAAMRQSVTSQIKVDLLRKELTSRAGAPKPSEVADYYVKNKEQFSSPELVHAMHIVKHTGAHAGPETSEDQALSALTEIKKQLDAGRSFEEVANENSDCGGNGGDLGWFPRGQMVESFEDVVFEMQPGEVSGIFKTEFGYHLAKVVERRPSEVRPLTEVRDEIAAHLLEQKKGHIIESYLDQQRSRAVIENVEETASGEA